MPLSLKETEAVSKIAQCLRDYLPGTPHPYADQSISFPGAAACIGIGNLWGGGSKLPAITRLLEIVLDQHRGQFCALIIEIVRRGITYNRNKGNPITREDIEHLNDLLLGVQFKVPELHDRQFLDTLPCLTAEEEPEPAHSVDQSTVSELKSELIGLQDMSPQPRGYAFEQFLNAFFAAYNLAPRPSFRLQGEQIDGSFQLDGETYHVEAKWQTDAIGQNALLIFSGKVSGKATWSRGLFISYGEFSQDGIDAFSKKGATNIIGMTGQDVWFILEGSLSLPDAIRLKTRLAAEIGEFYTPVFGLAQST